MCRCSTTTGTRSTKRSVRSVTANIHADGRAFLDVAGRHRLRATVTPYPLAETDRAARDLAEDRVNGAAVLVPA
jgi:alcohol dehydrogenase, propanol-preferring